MALLYPQPGGYALPPFLRCSAPGWGPGHLPLSLCLPQVDEEAALEVPSPRTVHIPAYVCVKMGHGPDSRECFSWQAPEGVGGGGGPGRGLCS